MSDILENAEMKMMSAIENLESNLHTLRTGRASSAMLDRIEVDYYGAPTPINQMARINVVEGTQLVIDELHDVFGEDIQIHTDPMYAVIAVHTGLGAVGVQFVKKVKGA